jgi:hypothetical protein
MAAMQDGPAFSQAQRKLLLGLQQRAIGYFLENQTPGGMLLDRQRNHGPRLENGLASTSTTGMGLIALALASAAPHRLIARTEAVARVAAALEGALAAIPSDRGMMPHFVDPKSGAPVGADPISTIDSAWLLAGGLWAAAFLRDAALERLADRLYERVDWAAWAEPDDTDDRALIRHGRGCDGAPLAARWDRLNGETIFMYVLAAGAAEGRALPAQSWEALGLFPGTIAGRRFNNADLGLFVFQYGFDLLDLDAWPAPTRADLVAEAAIAAEANRAACEEAAETFATYRRYWGLSAGDGPGDGKAHHAYRSYAPAGPIDGTAHPMAALASLAHQPDAVLENVLAARCDRERALLGRYGFSTVNVDCEWVGRDMVGIDAGAALLALDNVLAGGRVRATFHGLPCVQRGLDRLGFVPAEARRRAS